MAQTPAKVVNDNAIIDYIGTADLKAGSIVVFGGTNWVVPSLLDYSEQPIGAVECVGRVYDLPQAAEAIAAGTVVYWDADGTPVTGDASSGAATATSSGNKVFGIATKLQPNGRQTTVATDSYVRVAHLPWAS